jgi:hypothetical protein
MQIDKQAGDSVLCNDKYMTYCGLSFHYNLSSHL